VLYGRNLREKQDKESRMLVYAHIVEVPIAFISCGCTISNGAFFSNDIIFSLHTLFRIGRNMLKQVRKLIVFLDAQRVYMYLPDNRLFKVEKALSFFSSFSLAYMR